MLSSFEKTLTKKIVFTESSYLTARAIAYKMGLSFQGYLRYLVAQDIRKVEKVKNNKLTDNYAREILKTIHEMKNGRYRSINELETLVNRLVD